LITTNEKKYIILSGFIIGLAYLSKFIALSLFVLELVLFIYFLIKKDYTKATNFLLTGVITIFTITPYLIKNAFEFGFTVYGLLGKYGTYGLIVGEQSNYLLLGYWMLLNLSFIFLATGLIYPLSLFNFKINKNYNILFSFLVITTIVILVMASELAIGRPFEGHESRPIGRYLAVLYPLIIMLGSISLKNTSFKIKSYIPGLILLLISTKLFSYQLFSYRH
jgi:hypothetical protein